VFSEGEGKGCTFLFKIPMQRRLSNVPLPERLSSAVNQLLGSTIPGAVPLPTVATNDVKPNCDVNDKPGDVDDKPGDISEAVHGKETNYPSSLLRKSNKSSTNHAPPRVPSSKVQFSKMSPASNEGEEIRSPTNASSPRRVSRQSNSVYTGDSSYIGGGPFLLVDVFYFTVVYTIDSTLSTLSLFLLYSASCYLYNL